MPAISRSGLRGPAVWCHARQGPLAPARTPVPWGRLARRLLRRRSGPTIQRTVEADALARSPLPAVSGVADIGKLSRLGNGVSFDIDDLSARDVGDVSYVSRRRLDTEGFDPDAVDDTGLPLVYNESRIAEFWKSRPGELGSRWARFARIAVPWLTRLANAFIRGALERDQRALAADAVKNLEELGPTFIKLGQILSIRPDVLPPPVLEELAALQDNLAWFETGTARSVVECELGRPIHEVFSSFSAEPVAAASLAQVYRARLRETGAEVAVKVQRPGALATISKDLYVMRRGVGVYEAVVKRFTAQTTDYQRLLSTFAEGLYTEMDFRNEALNAMRMQELLGASDFSMEGLVIPQPILSLTTRRVLVMEWVTGVKLSTLPPPEIQALVKVGQEAFLTQLLDIGFMHGDPHPGNLLKITEGPRAGCLALLDFGLVAEIPSADRAAMLSATIHLANRDWDALIDDFVALGFLPLNADRPLIVPVMDRVLSPYLRGGGARSFNFQALSQDLLAATLEIPFSVPPYMSLLARSVATLEGVALVGDPGYQMVAQAYPFVVRKVLKSETASSTAVLRAILYDSAGQLQATRLSTLLNAALGYVADSADGFFDFDAVPEDGASTSDVVAFLLSPEAERLRPLVIRELTSAIDLFIRDRVRKNYVLLTANLQPRLPFVGSLPAPPPLPVLVPGIGMLPVAQCVELFFPKLSGKDKIALDTQIGLAATVFGVDPKDLGDVSLRSLQGLLLGPTKEVQELSNALRDISDDQASRAVAQRTAESIVRNLLALFSERAGVAQSTLFPFLPPSLRVPAATSNVAKHGAQQRR